ncbi:MAG: DoxX family protein [Bacteroidales bacterium]|nr:DoxX family protein [Bacteroidales bacterium]
MRKFHHSFRRFCALLIGLVFFVSGMFKLMDPVGTGLKMVEYFRFLHLDFMIPAGKAVGVAFSLLEALVGAALVSGIARKAAAVTVLALIVFFTGLTLALYLRNPEMDCGCFGEVLHLTHLQSLLKNLVLLALALIAFIPLSDGYEARKPKKWGFAVVSLLVVLFTVYSLRFLPMQDFTAFSCGSQILSGATEDDGLSADKLAVLSFSDAFGEYCDDLAAEGDVLVVSAYAPEELDSLRWERISALVSDALVCGIRPLLLAPSAEDVPMTLGECLYFTDYKTLLTLNRSNGGATYLADGLVVSKWAARNLPGGEDLSSLLSGEPAETAASAYTRGRVAFQGLMLLCAALLILL